MTDMIAAEPCARATDRRAARAPGVASRPARGGDPSDTRGGRPGHPDRLRHVRARRAGRRGDPARGGAAPPTSRTRIVSSEQAFELSLAPPTRGLVIGISHEGGTTATNAALRAARDAGRSTAVITVSRRSPAGALAGIVVETEELDHGWCHTVGYLSPIVAAAAVGAHLSGRPLDAGAVERTAGGRHPRRERRGTHRRRPGRRREPPRHRLGRRPSRRPRAGPQGRGGVLAAVGVPRPRDVPARAPAGDRRHDRPRPDPDRPRAARRADRASAPGARGGTGHRPASRGDRLGRGRRGTRSRPHARRPARRPGGPGPARARSRR